MLGERYRLAGVYAPANGEFSTKPFAVPSAAEGGLGRLWLNAAAAWAGNLVTGGCDEGCDAYIMVELQTAADGRVVPGFERKKCVLLNVDGVRLPLRWKAPGAGATATVADGVEQGPPSAGTKVQLRIFFRDATIFAFGVL